MPLCICAVGDGKQVVPAAGVGGQDDRGGGGGGQRPGIQLCPLIIRNLYRKNAVRQRLLPQPVLD